MTATVFKQPKNNAKSTCVSGELNNTTDPVTFHVVTGDGSKFPTTGNPFWVTVWSQSNGDPGDDALMEIIKVTSRTGDALTGARAQLNTSVHAHTGTPNVAIEAYDQDIIDLQVAVNNLEARAAVTLTDAATVALDASLGNLFRLTLGGNRTLGAITNPTDGQVIEIQTKQPASGGPWTLALSNAQIRFGTDLTAVTYTATASKMDKTLLEYHGPDAKWDVLAQQHGY